jgi:hypothetical protein
LQGKDSFYFRAKDKEEKSMRKFLVVVMAVAMTMGLALNAHAINTAQVTLTSPTITKVGCEKAGAVTFGFDAGSVLTEGDWWYMDLPSGVTICQTIDYGIFNGVGAVTANLADTVNLAATFTGATPGLLQPALTLAPGAVAGPLSVTSVGGGPANTVVVGNMAFLVYGASGTQRVWVYVFGDTATPALETLTVGASTRFNISILDGALHNGAVAAGIWLDSDNNGIYGDVPLADRLAGPVPDVNNTLCIDATSYAGDLVFVSFASLIDKFTFTGDAQIAHVGAAVTISLASCKGNTTGDIPIAAQGNCLFDYEVPLGYCTIPPVQFTGNRLLLFASGGFGGPGDLWTITLTSETAGVYWGGQAVIAGFTSAQDECNTAGTFVAGTTIARTAGGTVVNVFDGGTCSVAAASQAATIATAAGAIAGVNVYDTMWINMPALAYDTSVIGNGIESDVLVTLGKYPCGTVFTGTRTIGTFVTTCPPAAGTTNLLFPFTPAWDGSQPGWWGGFVIVNTSASAGTAALTMYDDDGDCATFTTPSIAANGGTWNAGLLSDLLTQVTDCTGNTGTFGDNNVNIVAVCNFTFGGGFYFVGNGVEGVGAAAYVLPGSGWN